MISSPHVGIVPDVVSHSPVPATENGADPLDDFEAYLVGLEGSREGDDLADLLFTSKATWGGTTRQLCSGEASAAVAWAFAEARKDGDFCPPLVFRILTDAVDVLREADRRLGELVRENQELRARLTAKAGEVEP